MASFSIDLQTASATVSTCIGGMLSRLANDSLADGKSGLAAEYREVKAEKMDEPVYACSASGSRVCIEADALRRAAGRADGGRSSGE